MQNVIKIGLLWGIWVCIVGCSRAPESINKPELQEPIDQKIGTLNIQDGSLSNAIDLIQAELKNVGMRHSILVSGTYKKYSGTVSLKGSNYSIRTALTELCEQINGSWRIEGGKAGPSILISHLDDGEMVYYGRL